MGQAPDLATSSIRRGSVPPPFVSPTCTTADIPDQPASCYGHATHLYDGYSGDLAQRTLATQWRAGWSCSDGVTTTSRMVSGGYASSPCQIVCRCARLLSAVSLMPCIRHLRTTDQPGHECSLAAFCGRVTHPRTPCCIHRSP